MFIGDYARLTPEKPAMISADTGRVITFRELDQRSMPISERHQALGPGHGQDGRVTPHRSRRAHEPLAAPVLAGLLQVIAHQEGRGAFHAKIVGLAGGVALAAFAAFQVRECGHSRTFLGAFMIPAPFPGTRLRWTRRHN